jgi:hypothetical protein
VDAIAEFEKEVASVEGFTVKEARKKDSGSGGAKTTETTATEAVKKPRKKAAPEAPAEVEAEVEAEVKPEVKPEEAAAEATAPDKESGSDEVAEDTGKAKTKKQ